MFARLASAIASATLITMSLIYAMQALIALQPGAVSPERNRHFLGSTFLAPRPETTVTESLLPDREDLTRTVETPGHEGPRTFGTGGGIGVYIPQSGPVITPVEFTGQPDGPLIAVIRVAPTYPVAAEVRGLEGWVDVRFDVMPSGATTNIEVIGASDSIFEKSAIRAAQRFRFKAPVIDGVPRKATGIEYRFRFDMND